MGDAAPVAVISGGASGIGLEIARRLAQSGYRLFLIARDSAKLEAARLALGPVSSHPIGLHALDVSDEAACAAAIDTIMAEAGQLDWLVTSAGIAEPGLFLEQSAEAHRRQMAVNYFGTLNLVRPAAAAMRGRGGRITLISSAAAFVGIAGYTAYAPGKAALKAFAEALSVELAMEGIAVSCAFPPDTDTPQYAAENLSKPEITKRITAGGGLMSAEKVAKTIVDQALRGRFMITPGALMTAFGFAHSLYAPLFRRQQKRVARKSRSQVGD